MAIHDWARVEAGIFHDFHHAWIEEIKRAPNGGLLPADYYAMAERHAAGVGPDVLALQGSSDEDEKGDAVSPSSSNGKGLLLSPPRVRLTAEIDRAHYRRKQNTVAVRHASGDRIVAMIEIVSPGNKSGRNALRSFVEKAADLLSKGVHLLLLDLHPPGRRDPHGIHAAVWEEFEGEESAAPEKPLILASYDADLAVRANVEAVAVGEELPEMPLFLEPGAHVVIPLAQTYHAAFAALPRRWQRVLEAG